MDALTTLIQDNTVLGIVIAAIGGITVRWLDRTLRQNTDYFSQASQIRKELREEVELLQKRLTDSDDCIDELEKEIDLWKGRYYKEVEARIGIDTSEDTPSGPHLTIDDFMEDEPS